MLENGSRFIGVSLGPESQRVGDVVIMTMSKQFLPYAKQYWCGCQFHGSLSNNYWSRKVCRRDSSLLLSILTSEPICGGSRSILNS